MYMSVIDSHIHIDKYCENDRNKIMKELEKYSVKVLIAVSNNLASSKHVHALSNIYDEIKPAYGYHPEQKLPSEQELISLMNFIEKNINNMVAIGEVGLPYYKKLENHLLKMGPYIEILENFIILAKKMNKPIVLHAIYDDAPVVCNLLEKHSVERAHFHWFKGNEKTIDRMIANNYFLSITPNILYEERARHLVATYPLHLIMVETDGPWQFSGPFKHERTSPKMIHYSMQEIAKIKKRSLSEVYETIYLTTKKFYLSE